MTEQEQARDLRERLFRASLDDAQLKTLAEVVREAEQRGAETFVAYLESEAAGKCANAILVADVRRFLAPFFARHAGTDQGGTDGE